MTILIAAIIAAAVTIVAAVAVFTSAVNDAEQAHRSGE